MNTDVVSLGTDGLVMTGGTLHGLFLTAKICAENATVEVSLKMVQPKVVTHQTLGNVQEKGNNLSNTTIELF